LVHTFESSDGGQRISKVELIFNIFFPARNRAGGPNFRGQHRPKSGYRQGNSACAEERPYYKRCHFLRDRVVFKVLSIAAKIVLYSAFEDDHKDQIHYETARQSRSVLGIGLIIRQN